MWLFGYKTRRGKREGGVSDGVKMSVTNGMLGDGAKSDTAATLLAFFSLATFHPCTDEKY
jgi:hypothetical protein